MKKFLSVIALVAICFSSAYASGGKKDAETPAKYIFLFIGDGMGNSQVAAAESYNSYLAGSFYGEQLLFTTFPVFGTCTSYSANSRVTDSSAAGTAIATGTKINNGVVGVDPEGNNVYSYALDFQEMGYNIAIFSSVPVNHATPASFYGHDASRGAYWTIATQIPEAGYKFMGGSGILNDKQNKDKDPEAYISEHGYAVVHGLEEYNQAKADAERILVLAEPRNEEVGNYSSVDKGQQEPMLLSEMMDCAIDFLGDDKPFFMMCEGGEIDWEAHANHTLPMVVAINKMDAAVKEAYEFYLKHQDETLIVITADHETGGISLGSAQSGYAVYWDVLIDDWNQNGIRKDNDENAALNNKAGLAWTTKSHTGAPVPVYAIGKGAEKFAGRMDNTEFRTKFLCR
ncbi:MAG: alkaline phosphatase [Bacteroidales bacterium]|nr:alkaline phosphatase [Candidatus Cryptobacteroides aphodequi]